MRGTKESFSYSSRLLNHSVRRAHYYRHPHYNNFTDIELVGYHIMIDFTDFNIDWSDLALFNRNLDFATNLYN